MTRLHALLTFALVTACASLASAQTRLGAELNVADSREVGVDAMVGLFDLAPGAGVALSPGIAQRSAALEADPFAEAHLDMVLLLTLVPLVEPYAYVGVSAPLTTATDDATYDDRESFVDATTPRYGIGAVLTSLGVIQPYLELSADESETALFAGLYVGF